MTDEELRKKVRDRINHGGEWGGRAVWQERMGRPSAAELKYLRRDTWSGWLSSAADIVDDRLNQDMPRLILGVAPWPGTSGSWWDASRGAYDTQWMGLWQQLSRFPPAQQRKTYVRFWEFNGGWYPWRVTTGPGSTKVDVGKARNMGVAVRRFLDLGMDTQVRYDHNLSGGMPQLNIETFRAIAWPGDDYVDRYTIDRYVSNQDEQDPDKWSASIEDMVSFARLHRCTPGITEGSLYQDKTKAGKQVGGRDLPGAVECLKRLDSIIKRELRSKRTFGDVMLFERDPQPEGHFAMFTLGASGTHKRAGDSTAMYANGKRYQTHCPNLVKAATALGWTG